MKIYNRKDFMKLGVCLYCKGVQWAFDGLCLKGDTLHNVLGDGIDFFYIDLCSIEYDEDMHIDMENMLKDGISKALNFCQSRDGMFNDEDVFLVYEIKDLSKLYCILKVLCDKFNQSMEYFERDLKGLMKPFIPYKE